MGARVQHGGRGGSRFENTVIIVITVIIVSLSSSSSPLQSSSVRRLVPATSPMGGKTQVPPPGSRQRPGLSGRVENSWCHGGWWWIVIDSGLQCTCAQCAVHMCIIVFICWCLGKKNVKNKSSLAGRGSGPRQVRGKVAGSGDHLFEALILVFLFLYFSENLVLL